MRMILAIGAVILFVGCAGEYSASWPAQSLATAANESEPRRTQAPTTQALASATRLEYVVSPPTQTDFDVLEVVLTDLLASAQFHGYHATGAPKTQIVLDLHTIQYPYPLDGMQELVDRMEDKGLRLADDLAMDFIRRSFGSISLGDYSPRNRNILVEDVESAVPQGRFGIELEFPKVFPSAKGWVRTRLPGYSADGRYAYVECGLHPAAHGASGYFMLRKENGQWTVFWRRVSYRK